jgi:hypothetical protein
MRLGIWGNFKLTAICVTLLMVFSIFQFLPSELNGLEEGSANTVWNQTSRTDFDSGYLDKTRLEGSGSGAYLTLQVGQMKEILTSKPEYSWGNYEDPFSTRYEDVRAQSIYLASELTSQGFSAGYINEIHLKCYQSPGRPNLKNFRIRLQNTASSSSNGWVTSGWTLVFGPQNINPTANNWYKFTLSTSFYWDGSNNLLMDLTRDDDDYSSGGGMYIRYFSGGNGSSGYRTYAGGSYSSYTWPFDSMWGYSDSFVPSVKFCTKIDKGTYTSPALNAQHPVDWNNISWNANTPENTEIKAQIRTGTDESDLYKNPFLGPDGSMNNYYLSSGQDIYSEHDGDSWIQYKLFLSAENATEPLKVHSVSLVYNCIPEQVILDKPEYDSWTNNNKPKFTWFFDDVDSKCQGSFIWQLSDDELFTSINYNSKEVVTNSLSYTPDFEIPDGRWFWRIRAMDFDGAWSEYSPPGRINIDTTTKPPVNMVVTPGNWTNKNDFMIDWTNPEDESGIMSGAYYHIGKIPPLEQNQGTWVNGKPITISDAPEGNNRIFLWLKDELSNYNYTQYSSANLKLDLTPAKPPGNITTTPDNWTSKKSFTIDWSNPNDVAGIKTGAYYFISDAPPTLQSDGTWMDMKPFTVTKAPEGESNLYLWLEDNLGNTRFLNYGETKLKLDTILPSIVHEPVKNAIYGRDIKVTVQILDESSGAGDILLYYKRPTDITYAKLQMKRTGKLFTATIAGDVVTSHGLEYYIEARDQAEPVNVNYFGMDGETKFEPASLTDIDITITSLPGIKSYEPKGNNAAINNNITITFNKTMEKNASKSAVFISPEIDGEFIWSNNDKTLVFSPKSPLNYNSTYTITISKKAKDTIELHLENEFSWSFTTETKPEPVVPPGGKTSLDKEGDSENQMLYSMLGLQLFIIILVILVFLFAFHMNRKRMKEVQEKLEEAQKVQQETIQNMAIQGYGQPMVPTHGQFQNQPQTFYPAQAGIGYSGQVLAPASVPMLGPATIQYQTQAPQPQTQQQVQPQVQPQVQQQPQQQPQPQLNIQQPQPQQQPQVQVQPQPATTPASPEVIQQSTQIPTPQTVGTTTQTNEYVPMLPPQTQGQNQSTATKEDQ